MIFLTIGSHEPFDRLVRAVDDWAAAHPGVEIFGQIARVGDAGYRPVHFAWQEVIGPQDYRARCAGAELIIAHAGMGSIITAMELSRPVVIMPRRGHLRETRNDHQWATAMRFAAKPGIFVAADESELAGAIDRARANDGRISEVSRFADSSLTDAIRGVIFATPVQQA